MTSSSSPDLKRLDSAVQHRRQMRRAVLLPMVIIALVNLLFILALIIPGSTVYMSKPSQFAIVSDVVLVCIALCPLVLCTFPLCVILMAGVFGMGKAHSGSSRGLRTVQVKSQAFSQRVAKVADSFNRKSIDFNVRFAFLDRLFSIFNRHNTDQQDGSVERDYKDE